MPVLYMLSAAPGLTWGCPNDLNHCATTLFGLPVTSHNISMLCSDRYRMDNVNTVERNDETDAGALFEVTQHNRLKADHASHI